ncbi:hypothetical protein CBI38_33540 (plasmid) [Rhodococcus oxybenzonivorans]|uniref:AB hydrolase-1 domain-containing protein n=1 Tax=Rhodococcus oxybenzonivorans TaxID=1990687 RepID=A0A2S2C6C2_9NOCA|nr:alpha/beta hydrolase [Rhodococcus oxybenzonivorans]AWK76363.1 hypothetical protein CBI38_33540 [Rhodococcus oxybenzonivorans]
MAGIFWHDVDGIQELQIWLMDRHRWVRVETVVDENGQPVRVGPPGWHVVGVGDFGGSSGSDILWHDIDGNRGLQIWFMNGHRRVDVKPVVDKNNQPVRVGPPGWHVVGVGRFGGPGGSGSSDILWHDIDGTKELQIWHMDGHKWVGFATVVDANDDPVRVGPPGWHVVGVGDFGGSSTNGILWHDLDGTKELQIWHMDGHKWVGFATVVDANDDPVRVGPPGWHVMGVGHFGGPGGDDILWHDLDGTKELQIWHMDGHKWVGFATVVDANDDPVRVGPPGWHVKGVRGTMHHLPAPCVQTGIIHTDYRLNFKIPPGLMPDRQFDSVHASLRVHRVSPTYANSDCKPARAIVLVHGRTLGGSTSFDLQHTTPATGPLSLQEALAHAGIDTFAPDLLGYALSTRLSLDDPKNASRPECTPTGDPTIDQCDRSRNKFIFPLDQQKRLQPNPLGTSYANHSSATYFGTTALWARDIRQVINDALIKTGLPTVSLLGYSFGGPRVGRTLQQLGITAADRIDRLIFMASLFDTLPTGPVDYPTDEADLDDIETSTSFPLVLNTVGWDTPSADRIPPGADKALAKQAQLLDAVGAKWGGSVTTPAGFVRSPTFTVSGWNKDVAAAITIPTLVLHGTEDRSVLPANAPHLYDALTTEQKVLIELGCASHFLHYETAPTWEGPHKAVADAIIEWVRSATFKGKTTGRFTIDCDGNVNPP